jgi:hypothetical protein
MNIDEIWQDLLDKDDRNSPEEYPDMVLVTQPELEAIIGDALAERDDQVTSAVNAGCLYGAGLKSDEAIERCASLVDEWAGNATNYRALESGSLAAAIRGLKESDGGVGSETRVVGSDQPEPKLRGSSRAHSPNGEAGVAPGPSEHVIQYVQQFGGRCRDCGDNAGVCPWRGMPCGDDRKAIRHVLTALYHGTHHGFIYEPDHLPHREALAEFMTLWVGRGQEAQECADAVLRIVRAAHPVSR